MKSKQKLEFKRKIKYIPRIFRHQIDWLDF